MSQETILAQVKPWVLVSSLKENTSEQELERITPAISELIDQWQSKGKMIWSGPLDNNVTGMAVFEDTEEEAKNFYSQYNKICSDILEHHLYQWDAMPILSILSKK